MFEKFTAVRSRYNPKISIRSNGSIGINQGAMKRYFSDKNYCAIILYFDKETQTIGIVPTENKNEEGVINLNIRATDDAGDKQGITAFLSAKSFFDYYNISFQQTRAYPVHETTNEGKKMIYIKLSEAEA